MFQLLNLYLFLYNSLQACGWVIALIKVLSNFICTKSVTSAYASAGELICLLQSLTLLETIHGAIGMKVYSIEEKELIMEPTLKWAGNPNILVAAKAFGLKTTVQLYGGWG